MPRDSAEPCLGDPHPRFPASGCRNHRTCVEEPMSLLLIDLEVGEQTAADGAQERFDCLGMKVG